MSILDAFVRSPRRQEKRYSFSDWAQQMFTFQGHQYSTNGYSTTWGTTPSEPIGNGFADYVSNALQSDGVISAVELVRLSVFSEARFQFQGFNKGRPGNLFGDPSLSLLEKPWPGGTTGDLLARMILDADLAGNFYGAAIGGQIVRLRPDWVDILLVSRMAPYGDERREVQVGWEKAGYAYYEGGKGQGSKPAIFLPDEVCHFAPYPDPLATYRGMSWLAPVVREIQADKAATVHKLKWFEHAATPNLAVSLPKEVTPEQFGDFVELMDSKHKGVENAYRTLYTGGGADVTVIGQNMQQMDFRATQGAGETRIAAAAGIHPVVVGLSEGMQGSSLNAGNYGAAKRSTADKTFRPLWRNAAGSLEVLIKPPAGSRLWIDTRDIQFLQEDEKDAAEILKVQMLAIESGTRAGFKPDTVKLAVTSGDLTLMEHSGLYSVQLIPPDKMTGPAPATTTPPAEG